MYHWQYLIFRFAIYLITARERPLRDYPPHGQQRTARTPLIREAQEENNKYDNTSYKPLRFRYSAGLMHALFSYDVSVTGEV